MAIAPLLWEEGGPKRNRSLFCHFSSSIINDLTGICYPIG
jgi:hypothetical protein